MTAQTPLETVELLDEAFNRSDIEAVVNFYEEDAVMVAEPNRLATGKAEIRATYEWIFANIKGTATQAKTHVIETDDIALFTSQWNFSGTMLNGDSVSRDSYASVILRRQTDGSWRIVVDNSWDRSFRMKDVSLLSTRRPTANRGGLSRETTTGWWPDGPSISAPSGHEMRLGPV